MLILLGCTRTNSPELNIAIASNCKWAMEEISDSFREEYGVKCNLISASSGKLTSQIREGAPYDLFFSADMIYPQQLFREGLVSEPPRVYALGKLVLWTAEEHTIPNPDSLSRDHIRRIAVANPKNAPYGRAAMEVLENYEDISGKLVFAENVSQVSQFVFSGNAEVGFTSKSIVLTPEFRKLGRWVDIDPDRYTPLEQGVVILTGDSENARLFFKYVFSEKSRKILNDYGYMTLNEQ